MKKSSGFTIIICTVYFLMMNLSSSKEPLNEEDLMFVEQSMHMSEIAHLSAFFKEGLTSEFRKKMLTRNLFRSFLLNEDFTFNLIEKCGVTKTMLFDVGDPLQWSSVIKNGGEIRLNGSFLSISKGRVVDSVRLSDKLESVDDLKAWYGLKVKMFSKMLDKGVK